MMERLQKVIAQAGVASRREAESLITAGKVQVNGKVVTELGTKVNGQFAKIVIDGKPLKREKFVYLLLHKPKGVLTTLQDPQGRQTVVELVKEIPERIYPVGRLDYNTEGLLLMTNDGELTNLLTHPSHRIDKTYLAKVQGMPTEEKLDKLRIGITLDDGLTAPALVKVLAREPEKNNTTLEIIIHEGKNRQVRRMCEAIGCSVRNLKRTQFAFLNLQGVHRGRYRLLTEAEVQALKELAARK